MKKEKIEINISNNEFEIDKSKDEVNCASGNKVVELQQIDKFVKLSFLYDFYGELLKENQRIIFEDYILEDLSLSEIASEQGISRQGVHDIIKRCSKQLIDYEEKLGLINKFQETKNMVNEIKSIVETIKSTKDLSLLEEVENLSNHILADL